MKILSVMESMLKAVGIVRASTGGGYEEKFDPTYAPNNRFTIGQPKWRLINYKKWTEDGYKKNVIARRVIDSVARHCSSIKICAFDGEKELPETHPLNVLLAKPNPSMSGKDFIRNCVAYYLLAGNSYFCAEGSGDTEEGMPEIVSELWPMRPDLTAPIPGVYGVQAYIFKNNGTEKIWNIDPITGMGAIRHWKSFNPLDNDLGMSVLESAAWSVDQHNAASEWNMNTLQNMGVPPGAFRAGTVDKPISLTPKQKEELRADIDKHFSGPKNARRPLLLSSGLNWENMGVTPVEADFLEGKNLSAREICQAFGTPGQMVGIPGDSTFNNYSEARLAFYEDTVLPLLGDFVDQLNSWLCPKYGDRIKLKIDEDSIPALAARRKEKWDAVDKATFVTPNEKRKATGFEPMPTPEADMLWVPSGLIPMEAGGEDDTGTPPDGTDPENPDAEVDPENPDDVATDEAGDLGKKPPTDTTLVNTAPATDVQAAALNGAQIAGLQAIIDAVASKDIPPETGFAMIQASFPSISAEAISAMLDPLKNFEKPKPPPTLIPPGGTPPPTNGKPPAAVPPKPAVVPPPKAP